MSIGFRLSEVERKIAQAARSSGRQPEEITLVAVTKTWPAETVVQAYDEGLTDFGENRAEELAQKRMEVGSRDIVWHQIGPLQSRKSNLAADFSDVFHALDRLKIARRLSARLVENGRESQRPLPVFLEVNVSGEHSKAGIDCFNWQTETGKRDMLLALAREISNLPGLVPQGLMTMAPWNVDEKIIRKVFSQTRQLSEWLQEKLPDDDWSRLSMGMTDDYEIAIEEGATHIRVGRAIFGERPQ